MAKVLVLLSTWNGMKFLEEQIQSLLAQDIDGELSILVRDDGSTDGTVEYLRSLGPIVTVIEGRNVGPRASFFDLLRLARNENADTYALCDQDDVWDPQKIRRAQAELADGRPGLYASALDLVDEALVPIRTYVHPGDRSFVATLMCNYVTGCTCVFNRPFLEQLPFPSDPEKVIMHDWWLASIATIKADIRYDRKSLIAYRQHASNHVGIKSGMAATLAKIRKAVTYKPSVTRFDHARQLRTAMQEQLDPVQRRTLERFLASEHSPIRRSLFALQHVSAIGLQGAMRFAAFG
ncbi:glycosyltransferase involved in cell wall biosynthesis [Sphingomonas faeni]|uniref:Glycosyltransferase involved in cell wall biosynthesis n=1 Tax=Sphingomonas faeni TaxID=185950 RepID=A0A2T5TXZ7_9SPHN|nr:glycosyltransferase family 2 protein [Sphingomonas faeni]PTW44081.1 glycosyltransferase involved in cell wall biosynthesis [Sphingomonas faeni]